VKEPADGLFADLDKYQKVMDLITAGEAEGQYLECKAPSSPLLDKGLKNQLAIAVSGFANSGGGVILIGVSTTNKLHSGLDILTQIEPIGHCEQLALRIDRAIPTLVTPVQNCPPCRVLREKTGDTKGIVCLFIPKSSGDPVQCLDDSKFYIRVGAEFNIMPFDILKRMFAGSDSPDLGPIFDSSILKIAKTGTWSIPIVLANKSSRVARDVNIIITVMNPKSFGNISATQSLKDASSVNPGKTVFIATLDSNIHRGLNHVAGYLNVTLKTIRNPSKILMMEIKLLADGMRGRSWVMEVKLKKSGFIVTKVDDTYLY
jgi:hypothetical protein